MYASPGIHKFFDSRKPAQHSVPFKPPAHFIAEPFYLVATFTRPFVSILHFSLSFPPFLFACFFALNTLLFPLDERTHRFKGWKKRLVYIPIVSFETSEYRREGFAMPVTSIFI